MINRKYKTLTEAALVLLPNPEKAEFVVALLAVEPNNPPVAPFCVAVVLPKRPPVA